MDFFRCASRYSADRQPSQRIIAAPAEVHVREPDRPQAAGSLCKKVDDLLDYCLGRQLGHDPREQRDAAMLRGFNLIEEIPQAFAIDTAERDHRASGSAKNELRNGSPWQLVAQQTIADFGACTGGYRSVASAVGKIGLGHAAPRLTKYLLSNFLARMRTRKLCRPSFKGRDKSP
jgi:hypothetical protein